jgi:outer membrane protein OmpA-like peptidoglycan-associated protein
MNNIQACDAIAPIKSISRLFKKTKKVTLFITAITCLYISGCGPTTHVVLLPDPNGKVGILEVTTQKGAQTLQEAWQVTESNSQTSVPSTPKIMEEKLAKKMFHEALEAAPLPPVHFIITFRSDSAEVTRESMQLFSAIMAAIHERKSTDIIVSGHTDSVGGLEYNRRLSLRRARAIAGILIKKGVQRSDIQITYHGKENPLIKTPEGVPEPRNRRVEISVR